MDETIAQPGETHVKTVKEEIILKQFLKNHPW
jgi:hypothetical protein